MKKLLATTLLTLSAFAGVQADDIAVLGWGSLIWQPGELAMQSTWEADGPLLPIEFSRVSADGRLTLVIDPKTQGQGRKPVNVGGNELRTLYVVSALETLDAAVQNLKAREGSRLDMIGYVNLRNNTFRMQQIDAQSGEPRVINGSIRVVSENANQVDIAPGSGIRKEYLPYLKNVVAWTLHKRFDATIWTGLTNNFQEKVGRPHTLENSLTYLNGLTGAPKQKAIEYIQKAPVKNQTKIGPRIPNS